MATRRRTVIWVLAAVSSLVLLALLVVRLVYGSGRLYPDVSTAALLPSAELKVLVELPFPPGNVTSSADGRVFFNLHPFGEPARFTQEFVFELVAGQPRAYPDAPTQQELSGVLGMTVDRQNRLWLIRPAGIEDRPTRLFGYDLLTNRRIVDYTFEEGLAPFAQDLRVSPDGKTIYLADTGILRFSPAALIVFDVPSKTARRVLEGHASVAPEDWVMQSVDGPYKLAYGLVTFSVGVDGVAVSQDGQWLYYATMSHGSAYRVPTRDLRDAALSPAELAAKVERVGPKPLSDGIELDAAGNLYITDVEHGGVARLSPNGKLETMVKASTIVWADGINLTHDGRVLFTDSEIPAYIDQLLRPPSRKQLSRAAPHRIYAFRAPSP